MKNVIYLGGGCFWGVEKYLQGIKGIDATFVGYANGDNPMTTYKQVCAGSGHAEVVKVEYGDEISLSTILDFFVEVINPFSINKQGNDIGVQYRTGIYFEDENLGNQAKTWLANFQKSVDKPIAIECKVLEHFCMAEPEHQKYLDNNPNGYCHIPKSMFEYAVKKSHDV